MSQRLALRGRRKCVRPGCRRFAKWRGAVYCSRSCVMKDKRSKQSPEYRRALAIKARAVQETDRYARLFARCRLLPTEELRLLAAYRYGLSASKQRRYKANIGRATQRSEVQR